MKNIKTIGITVLLVAIIGGYILYQKFATSPSTNPNPQPNPDTTQGQDNGQNQQQQPPTTTGLKDGTYTGNAVDAFYGTVQVKATISGGKITNIALVQYPNNAGHTTEVSNMSLPILKSEAITAQSANIDVVSGATQTSQGFMQSLQSALVQAGSTDNTNIQVVPPGLLGA